MPISLKPRISTALAAIRSVSVSIGAFAAIALTPSLASAQSQDKDIRPFGQRVLGDKIEAHFSGKTHAGAYNFSRRGEARDFYVETHNKDGSVVYTEGGERINGRWGVFNDVLCYYYTDNSISGGCFRVYRVENCYYFYSDNLPDNPAEIDGDFWTARSTLKGERPKCEAAIS